MASAWHDTGELDPSALATSRFNPSTCSGPAAVAQNVDLGPKRPSPPVLSSIAMLRPDPRHSVSIPALLWPMCCGQPASLRAECDAATYGSGHRRRRAVSRRLGLAIVVPLPPLPEQRRIAALLDKADAIRRKRQQAIRLADDLLRSTFLDMFGDPVEIPRAGRWNDWTMLRWSTEGSSTPRPRNDPRYYGGPYPFIQPAI